MRPKQKAIEWCIDFGFVGGVGIKRWEVTFVQAISTGQTPESLSKSMNLTRFPVEKIRSANRLARDAALARHTRSFKIEQKKKIQTKTTNKRNEIAQRGGRVRAIFKDDGLRSHAREIVQLSFFLDKQLALKPRPASSL